MFVSYAQRPRFIRIAATLALLAPLFMSCSDIGGSSIEPLEISEVQVPDGMVLIPGGRFEMGGDAGEMGGNSHSHQSSYPIHEVYVDAFWMDETEVTNREFAAFVEATGYKTFAERPLPEQTIRELKEAAAYNLKMLERDLEFCSDQERVKLQAMIDRIKDASKVAHLSGSIVFQAPDEDLYSESDINQWWRLEPLANWRAPKGPGTRWEDRLDHPVVNVTYEDAAAYAEWAGKRLPTEAEWEKAARGGLARKPYAWGEEFFPNGDEQWMANIWQGEWPHENTAEDGHKTTSPVKQYPPNPYGLYDIAGNVWEIVSDYYHPLTYSARSSGAENPKGPPLEAVKAPGQRVIYRITRGGSFLCSDVWCKGYQPGSRQPVDNESPANHTGFRCVKDVVEAAKASDLSG